MEIFSLEEDECSEMFLTQSDQVLNENVQELHVFGNCVDMQLPLVSLKRGTSSMFWAVTMRIFLMMISKYRVPR